MEESREALVKLYAKLFEIQQECNSVEKSGKNTHQNYNYSTEADVLKVVKKSLSRHKVLCEVDYDNHRCETIKLKGDNDKPTQIDYMDVILIFRDIETGAMVRKKYFTKSYGTNNADDKGIFKSQTGGLKYALVKYFLIETGEKNLEPENQTELEKEKTTDPSKVEYEKMIAEFSTMDLATGEEINNAMEAAYKRKNIPSTNYAGRVAILKKYKTPDAILEYLNKWILQNWKHLMR